MAENFSGPPENLTAWQSIHQAVGYILAKMPDGDEYAPRLVAGLLKAAERLEGTDG